MATGSKTTAKVAGKVKGMTKALAGYPGIFHHLAGEHGEVSALMMRVAGSSEDSEIREELFPEIRRNLLAHAKAEEKEFYPPLRRIDALKELVSRAVDEHHKVEEYIEELESGNKATKSWLATFERMMRAVQAHVEMEESEIFPVANEHIEPDEAKSMEERYRETEERLKEQL